MLENFSGDSVAIVVVIVALVVVLLALTSKKKNEDPDAPISEQERQDAKRFAKLLVSEIKLYNERAIAEGKANNNVYLKVKTDIDKSQELYEKRVRLKVQQEYDYFREALVDILCDGDARLLGK